MSIKINAMKTCYISGRITGLPVEEYTANFERAAAILTLAGFIAVSPLNIKPLFKTWFWFMVSDLFVLTFCDCIYMLDNWRDSRGAMIEYKWAKFLRKEIIEL